MRIETAAEYRQAASDLENPLLGVRDVEEIYRQMLDYEARVVASYDEMHAGLCTAI